MAGRNYKAEYARRIANATAKGKTRQQARGHQAREHILRAQREKEEHGLTTAQMRSITAWASRYKNEDRNIEDIIDHVRAEGYEWFVNYRDVWNAARRQYLRELRSGRWTSRGEGYLRMLADSANAPEVSWLYYH